MPQICRHIILPARSADRWLQWTSLGHTMECALGTLSPVLTDQDSSRDEPVPQPPEGDPLHIKCHLDPDLFQNSISDEQGGRSTWTMKQRDKARGCPTLSTPGELLAWVSRPKRLFGGLLIIFKQLNSLPPSGKSVNRLFRRLDSTFNDGSVLVL